jgi:hypothetical protein
MKEVYKIPVLSVGVAHGTKRTGKPNALFLVIVTLVED